MATIEIEDLQVRYRRTVAVDGVSMRVAASEVVGLLGPNGAGKSSTIEALAGLRAPTSGSVRVWGLDPVTDRRRLRPAVGVQLQESTLHGSLKVDELLTLYASFYPDPRDPGELVEELGLTKVRRTAFDDLSGGQQQRLSIAIALVGRPRLVVLDELTTGLDPRARRRVWALVERLRADGVTVLLVSHAMDEVERLCDRVVLLVDGRVRAEGAVADLVREAGLPPGSGLEDAYLALVGRRPDAGEEGE
ncbi:ABC transporter ATP-binding protein [Aeromicrobium alkaliterrae]|uniref:ABC transporter ATP-binding protein n=1 Tax=Aeromicrobium alkaliterrae TaxID=302168 RepID=A0ABP4VIS9_9ACTN